MLNNYLNSARFYSTREFSPVKKRFLLKPPG